MLFPLWKGFTYFTHQEDGIEWMLRKEREGTAVGSEKTAGDQKTVFGGFQCDDMGLGKTIQTIATMAHHRKKLTLLLAPVAMLETWAEVCLHAGMIVFEVEKGAWVRRGGSEGIPRHFMKCRPAVYVSNYEKLHQASLFDKDWDRVVLDEAHKIRNPKGALAKAARALRAPIRWALTGTPLVNSLRDVVSLFAFLGVPCSPSWRWESSFRALFPYLVIHRSLAALRKVIQGAPPVPVIHEEVLPFLTEDEEEFYHGVQGGDEAMSLKYAKELLSPREMFKLLLRLRQISVHPQVYINAKRREGAYERDDWTGPTTKLNRIGAIIGEADGTPSDGTPQESLHKYIVFCQFNEEMSLMRDYLLERGLAKDEHILMYHGGMTQAERTAVLAHSKKTTETTVLLLQLQAGGVGLNLQEYDRVLFVSPWWTAALMDQAIARAVRMGQNKVVHVYHLRLASEKGNTINIDALVNAKADEKRKQLEKLFALCSTF
jgi:SNF2 family DNA or RNA helicase